MTRPTGPTPSQVVAMSGAVDLSALKAHAQRPAAPQHAVVNSAQPNAQAQDSAQAGDSVQTEGDAQSVAASNESGTLSSVMDVTDATFEDEVLRRSLQVPVVIDLWASWCGPCKQLSPILEKLASSDGGKWVLAKIDVDANPQVAQLFGVQSIPTVVALAAGQPIANFQGAQPEPQIRKWLDSILQAVAGKLTGPSDHAVANEEPAVDDRVIAAQDALNVRDFDQAIALFEEILAEDPTNTDIAAALRRTKFLHRVAVMDPAILTQADQAFTAVMTNVHTAQGQDKSSNKASLDLDVQLQAADIRLATGEAESAFDRIIALIKIHTGDDKEKLRTHLLQLFELSNPSDPIVTTARRKLASALY